VIFGSIGAKSLNSYQNSALGDFVNNGLSGFENTVDFSPTMRQALNKNLYNLLKLLVLGLTVIGLPLILALIFTRGFVLGFTVTFLIRQKAWQGGLIALLAILPPNILSLPTHFIAAVLAINCSLFLIRGDNRRSNSLAQYFLSYLGYFLILTVIMIASALIEGYLTPLLIRLLH
ncbi:MAG: stage II sporulation protein M, partial [Peptococcia bacterium]